MNYSDLLLYAKQYVPFYRSYPIMDVTDIHSFPIIKKEEYIKDQNSFFSVNADKANMKVIQTSGSTGTPMTIYKSNKDYMAQLRCLWRIRHKLHGISANDRCINFIMSEHRPSQGNAAPQVDSKMMLISINAIDENIGQWMREINAFQPSYIIGYPSVISHFANAMAKAKCSLPDSVRYIECMGEYLFPAQQKLIEDFLERTVTNYYGCSEIFGIAYSCEKGKLHILSDNAFVEVIPNGEKTSQYGKKGEVVVTGINSIDAPFVRYNLEDVGVLYKGDACSCGCKEDFLEMTMSRTHRYIRVSSDRSVHSSIFYGFIEAVNASLDHSIYWFKFIQADYHTYTLYLQMKKGYEIFLPEIEKRIKIFMRQSLDESISLKVIPRAYDYDGSEYKKYNFIESIRD